MPLPTLNRRRFLLGTATATAGAAISPLGLGLLAGPQHAAAATLPAAFVDAYKTNTTADLTASGNAAVRALSGFAKVWRTGDAWNTGTVLDDGLLRANLRYCARITGSRTQAEAKDAFLHDRQDQSYGAIAGLGPLAAHYYAGAKAVTGITSAPDGTPDSTIDDAVPADAPAGSALGAGATDSELGTVVTLVKTLRGSYASGNPSKAAYQYPRPWRMNENSVVVDTGTVDALGYPVYDSRVTVAPQLLRQRGTDPASDGGFPSGHTNAFHLAALAYAYAVPERFQELVAHALRLAHTRIVSGMHSPVDVIGGRILATALAAATLHDPANASLKAAARAQALTWFTTRLRTDADGLLAYAHSSPAGQDPYADRRATAAAVAHRLTYGLPRRGRTDLPFTVPAGAESLLETRQPYLTADQRREVLRTTALPSGHALLDGYEQWGRLDLYTAADGYGAFDGTVSVALDAAHGGLAAADTWRNDIGGTGGLTLNGTGTLTLTGENAYRGGTVVAGGTLVAGSRRALGRGDVTVRSAGTLRVTSDARIDGGLLIDGGTLELAAGRELSVDGRAWLGGTLVVPAPETNGRHSGAREVTVIRAGSVRGRFSRVLVAGSGWTATADDDRRAVTVRYSRTR